MSRSSIEWLKRPGTLPESWNFITGCNKVSRGCKFCYAEVMHRRLQYMYPAKYDHDFLSGAHVHEDLLTLPLTWKKPRTVFVNSMSDLFHKDVPFDIIQSAYSTMQLCPQHTFIIATKRPERAVEFYNWLKREGMPELQQQLQNVWMLASVEDQATANERLPWLVQIPAAVKGISAEPLLGHINIEEIPIPPLLKFETGRLLFFAWCGVVARR